MEKEKKLHIVMFPWLAFGHFVPFLELSKLIAEKGHLVSFVSTPRNIDRLPKIPPHLSPLIKLVRLPLPKVENLPHEAEATLDVPNNVVHFLKKAYDELQQPMNEFLESSKPDWIFYDFSPYWIGPIVSKLGIKSAFFSILMATTMVFFGSSSVLMGSDENSRKTLHDFTVPPPWVPFPTTLAFKYYEIMKMADLFSDDNNESSISDAYRVGMCIQNCDIVLIRSCFEFEGEWLQLLQKLYHKPVIPVGQLPTIEYDDGRENDTWTCMREWLDSQSRGRVVYVAFGSEAKPSQEEVREIALGLEKSELPFLWAFRAQRGPTDPEVLRLPEGFEDRTRGRGMVCTGWAPQMKILSHDSVGGFLTHSGASSVVEAIQNEKPLVFLAFQVVDQGLISRVLEEKDLGHSIPRDERDGSFTSDSVANALRMVVLGDKGRMYREKMKEMKDLFVNSEIQERYVESLLSYLRDYKKSQK